MRVFCLGVEVERDEKEREREGDGKKKTTDGISPSRGGEMKSRTVQAAPLSRLNITLYSVDAINSLEKCAYSPS